MSSRECFSALGVVPGSSEDAIKNAYRKLVKVHHPDLGGKADTFMRIQRAYENLTDPSMRPTASGSSTSSSSSSLSSGRYWKSWDTDSTWWSQDADDFDSQWRKFTEQKRREKRPRTRKPPETESTTGRKSSKKYSKPEVVSSVHLSIYPCNKRRVDDESIWGVFHRISQFNGRACFVNHASNVFLFWSNRNKDWKISKCLKDEENCIAFADRIHPTEECPFVIDAIGKWMQWSNKTKRYYPVSILAMEGDKQSSDTDYSSWSIDQLRTALESIPGLEQRLAECFEKQQLVELAEMYRVRPAKSKKPPNQPPLPDQYQLCSRQRHDGVVQAPPVLSERCTTHKNRLEGFSGKLEELEDWLWRHGDRRRLYGVYDHEGQFAFSLIWKDDKHWGRTSKIDF
jgi:hypothetical protein